MDVFQWSVCFDLFSDSFQGSMLEIPHEFNKSLNLIIYIVYMQVFVLPHPDYSTQPDKLKSDVTTRRIHAVTSV